jgi:hypothetical protein
LANEDAYARYVVVKEPGHEKRTETPALENRTCGCREERQLSYIPTVSLVDPA